MAAQHTPGPWRQGKNANLWIYSEQRLIVKVCPDSISSGANARLIAAAPDLLEALEAVNEAFHRESLVEHRGDVMPKVWAAIRKAKGEQ